MSDGRIVYDEGADVGADELIALFAQTSWARQRGTRDVAAMLRATPVAVSARADGVLVGYARALTDGRFRAHVDDVVVDASWRGRGVGIGLMERLMDRLAGVEEVRLNCGPDVVPFYERMGFALDRGTQMIARTDRG